MPVLVYLCETDLTVYRRPLEARGVVLVEYKAMATLAVGLFGIRVDST